MKQSAEFLIKVAWEGGHVSETLNPREYWRQISDTGFGQIPTTAVNIAKSTGLHNAMSWDALIHPDASYTASSAVPQSRYIDNPGYIGTATHGESAIMNKYKNASKSGFIKRLLALITRGK